MAYSTRNNSQIKDFWPDDSDTEMYLESGSPRSLKELMEIAKKKWPDAMLSEIDISSEKIHTYCITYDQYDPGDYTDFIVLTYNPE